MSRGVDPSKTAFLDGGRMGALMRSHDWSRSPLGEPAAWPDALKAAVATCLSSRFPMVVWWGPQLLMLYNDAWQPILGETKHPAGLGRPGEESWRETWPIVGVQFENALKGVASWSEDLLLASDRHGFLEECYFTYSHSALRDASGEVVGVLSVVSETTARVLNERRLRTLRALSNATVDATSAGKSLHDLCGTLVDLLCNENPDVPFAAQYLIGEDGRARIAACAGIEVALLPAEVVEDDDDSWQIAEVLRTQQTAAIDCSASPWPLQGGVWPEPARQIVVLPLSRSQLAADKCGVLLVGVSSRLRLDAAYMDFLRLVAAQLGGAVSALQLFERERVARNEAERAARMRDEFIATLSHELRTPLTAVIGWTQLLRNDLRDAARVSSAVEVIERNARQQAQLITDLLDISRAISGNMRLALELVSLPAVIDSAIQSAMPAAVAKGVRMESTVEPIAELVLGDPARIQQMLGNLLSNAVKFTPSGGRVHVALASAGRNAEIRVSDDGEGVDPEFLPFMFDRFRQADGSHARRHGGLGLGLTIVKEFAELHGGSVRAISAGAGCGATIVLQLPLSEVADAGGEVSRVHRAATSAPKQRASLSGLRVLLVDDQPDALAMIRSALEDESAHVHAAASAESAFDVLDREAFHVIVSDIAMPGLDGYAFIAELRKRGIAIPALALTAFALADDRRKALTAGYQGHLSKPVDIAALLATVAQLGERRSPKGFEAAHRRSSREE